MLNSVHIIGRLGRDPEIRYSASGSAIANLRIATDESYTDRDGNKVDKTEWHTAVVFGKSAEACANHLQKGSLVFVDGSLQTRKWQNQQGQDRYSTEIKANRVQFLDRKSDAGQQEQPRHQQEQVNKAAPDKSKDNLSPAFPSGTWGMDDVPF